MGDYIPPASADVGGFTTSGKSRGTILAKLEEILRNRQLTSYSSRFYEELKVFTWNTGRAQARSGFNDDLVMSLAIGSWLVDGSSDYSKSTAGLNEAMLSSISKSNRSYSDVPDQVLAPIGVYGGGKNSNHGGNTKQDLNKTKNRSMIPHDYMWVLK